MALPRFQKLEPARRDAILDAASAEFSAHGFSGASYNTIIKAAGLSKGAMYYYFADKADLCRTVVERVVGQLGEAAGELGNFDDAAGYWREMEALAERAITFTMALPEVADLARMIYGEGGNAEVLAPLIERTERWCGDRLREGQAVGAVRSDLPLGFLATAVTGLLVHTDRWLGSRLDELDPAELQTLSAACLELVQRVATPGQTNPLGGDAERD